MMTDITREITRVDFVKQADGTVTFCVEITETVVDPFDPAQTLRRIVEPRPMTPEVAMERFGLALSDIVVELNTAAIDELARVKVALAAALEALEELKGQINPA
jgi:hypothetical protein